MGLIAGLIGSTGNLQHDGNFASSRNVREMLLPANERLWPDLRPTPVGHQGGIVQRRTLSGGARTVIDRTPSQ
jgi:hypothetical protein